MNALNRIYNTLGECEEIFGTHRNRYYAIIAGIHAQCIIDNLTKLPRNIYKKVFENAIPQTKKIIQNHMLYLSNATEPVMIEFWEITVATDQFTMRLSKVLADLLDSNTHESEILEGLELIRDIIIRRCSPSQRQGIITKKPPYIPNTQIEIKDVLHPEELEEYIQNAGSQYIEKNHKNP